MEQRRRHWFRWLVGSLAVLVAALLVLNGVRLVDGAVGWWVGGRISEAVSQTADGETVDLARVYDADWDRAVWIGPYLVGDLGNDLLGFGYYRDDELLSTDDMVSRLLFVKGTDVLADVELHRIYLEADRAEFTRSDARFVVWRDSIGVTLDPAETATP